MLSPVLSSSFRIAGAALLLLASAVFAPANAQGAGLEARIPTPEQAQDLLKVRPELVTQLRQRLATSGLSPAQVRTRLRAAGYSDVLLDQILGSTSVPVKGVPGDSMISALKSLGIVDSADAAVLRRLSLQQGVAARTGSDSVPGVIRVAPVDSAPIFGLDLFAGATSQFDANTGGPVDASYRLGPGDGLVLILTGDVEEAYTLDVTREGFIVVPAAGQIAVANLTLGELESVLRKRLGRVFSGIGSTTRFTVSVARLRSNQVFVVGDVRLPGSYRISSAGTALSALYAAGGPSERGSLRTIQIRRRGRAAQAFDVYDYLIRGDASGDIRLENGDVLFVPTHGARVRVTGGVLRPATYELRVGETLDDLVQSAGGFTDDASQRRVRIRRIVPPAQRTAEGSDRIVLDVAVPKGTGNGFASVRLEAGDIVEVMRVAERVRGRIAVRGNVWQPGTQGIAVGETLTDALRRAGGLKPDSYLGRVIVSRLRADSTREQLHAILRDIGGATSEPLVLQEDDDITVFSLTEFRAPRYVAVSGAVGRPGQYGYREGMTMRDLVLLAGGLEPSAQLNDVEIARLPERRDNGTLATTFRAPIDSSYVVGSAVHGIGETEILLQPYDNVLVFRQPDWQLQTTVRLTGEVRYPGVYTLTSKKERLSDLIGRAGGLTPYAFASGIAFYRADGSAGRVGIDLPRVMRNPGDDDNLLMVQGDSVHVPRFNALVMVSGAVNSPLAVPYQVGASLSHYIRAAGGATRDGDTKQAYVEQANGKVESKRRAFRVLAVSPTPGPGSRVVVPSRDASEKRDLTALLGTVAQIVGSVLTVVLVLNRTK